MPDQLCLTLGQFLEGLIGQKPCGRLVNMPKPFLPPQGGEKWLCLGMFLTLMFSVICIVVVIYCIVIIYDPSVKEIYSNINSEPKRCTTTLIERNITGTPEDQKCNWSSCEEWCLSKGASPCSKVERQNIF